MMTIISGEGGRYSSKEVHDSHVGHACNNCSGSMICISPTEKCSTHEKEPCLHDSIVTVDMDENRLLEIPPSGCELPDVGLTRIQ